MFLCPIAVLISNSAKALGSEPLKPSRPPPPNGSRLDDSSAAASNQSLRFKSYLSSKRPDCAIRGPIRPDIAAHCRLASRSEGGRGGGGGGRKSDSPPSLIPFARKGDATLQIESMSVEPAYQLQGPTGTSGTVPTSLALFQVPKPIPAVPRRAEARPSDTP